MDWVEQAGLFSLGFIGLIMLLGFLHQPVNLGLFCLHIDLVVVLNLLILLLVSHHLSLIVYILNGL